MFRKISQQSRIRFLNRRVEMPPLSRATSVPLPTNIILSDSTIDDNASVGDLVGNLFMVGGTEPATYSITTNPSNLWQIDGSQLEVAASLAALGGTTSEPVIRVTDGLGRTFSKTLTLTIAAAEVANPGPGEGIGDPVVTPEVTVIDQNTSDGLKVTGKSGGTAAFLMDWGVPVAGSTYTMKYSVDWSQMSRLGREASVGFAFKSGNNFHLAALRGNGATPTVMLKSKIHGNFSTPKTFTITNDGTATNGTKDGPNWLQIAIAESGSTYTLRTSADGVTWFDQYTAAAPSPLTNATDALQFGPGAFFTSSDFGVFRITIESYQESVVFLSSFDGADASQTATDDSFYGHTIVFGTNGSANSELDTAQKVFGTASAFVNAADAAVASIAMNDHEVFNPTGDYTWEGRFRFQSLTGTVRTLFSKWNNAAGQNSYWLHYRVSDQTLRFTYSTDGTNAHATICEVPFSAVINTWYAIRVCKVGSDILFYVDGTYLGKDTLGGTIFDSGTSFRLGASGNSTSTELQGWIDEVRLTKGVARSGEANYTVDTSPFPRG